MPKAPCKGCPDRTVDPRCQDPERCERWAAYAAELEKVRDARQAYVKTWAAESGRERARIAKLKRH